MTVVQIFTKIGNFIENKHTFMLLDCNCAKLTNSEDFKTCLGEPVVRGHSVYQYCMTSAKRLVQMNQGDNPLFRYMPYTPED